MLNHTPMHAGTDMIALPQLMILIRDYTCGNKTSVNTQSVIYPILNCQVCSASNKIKMIMKIYNGETIFCRVFFDHSHISYFSYIIYLFPLSRTSFLVFIVHST